MASLPRWPLPSGSKGDGPMGSWTRASSAKRSSQPSRSLAWTAARERAPSSRAVRVSLAVSVMVAVSSLSAHFRDDIVGEAAQVVDLRLQRLGVLLDPVGPPEPDDDVGDAELLEPADAVGRVGVGGDHVYLERLFLCAVLLAEDGEAIEQAGEVGGIAAAVQPAVTVDGCPSQGGLVMTADENRHGTTRCGTHLYGRDVED